MLFTGLSADASPNPDSMISVAEDVQYKDVKSVESSRKPDVVAAILGPQTHPVELRANEVTCTTIVNKLKISGLPLKALRENGSVLLSKGTYEIASTTYVIERWSHSEPKSVVEIKINDETLRGLTCYKAGSFGRAAQYPTNAEINLALTGLITIK